MLSERISSRFDDIGRFEVEELCALPGALVNISKEGCKIRYNFPVVVDLENDYPAKITFARKASKGLNLLCHPMWVKTVNDATEIGFKILPSQDYANLSKYVDELHLEESNEELDEEIHSSVSVCQIIK